MSTPVAIRLLDSHEAQPSEGSLLREAQLVQYQTLVQLLTYLFQEFWQTNNFFTTASSVTIATWLLNWQRYLAMRWYEAVALSGFVLIFVGVWRLSVSRHVAYITLHMNHAAELEDVIPGLDLYRRRRLLSSKNRLSVTETWRRVPVVVACAVIVLTSAKLFSS